jgi:hypothetical protein
MMWFLIKHQFIILYRLSTGVQGYALDKDVVIVSEGGENEHFKKWLPTCGNIDNGYIRQIWVEV